MDPERDGNYQFVSVIPESRLKPVEEEKNPLQKTWRSFGEIGIEKWDNLMERGSKATDSWYDFGNYLTLGSLDLGQNAYAGLQYNAKNMTNSPLDFVNFATMGGVDMVNAAVNPDDAFSKEHWMASFGVFFTGVGVRGVSVPRNAGTPKANSTNAKAKSPDQKNTVPATQATSTTPKLPTLTNIREWYRVNMPETGLVQDGMGGYHFATTRGNGGSRANSGENGKGKMNSPNVNKLPKSTYNERLVQTPINNGRWIGKRGESTFISDDKNVKNILKEVDKKGIVYSDAIPDFSIVSKGQVQIPNMGVDRRINFREADNLLAMELGVTRKEIVKMRKTNKLTWHELNDMKSM